MKLIVRDLTVDRSGRPVLAALSLSVEANEPLILRGANGAGKTTLLRTIAGFLALTAGEIRLDGGDPELTVPEQCHYVGHANAIKTSLTAAENLTFWARYLGAPTTGIDEAVDAALERFGIAALADIRAGFFSAGQKRRLALARLLVAQRAVWLLDEPSVSLDAASTAILASVVRNHVERGGLVIAATHIELGLDGSRTLILQPQSEAA